MLHDHRLVNTSSVLERAIDLIEHLGAQRDRCERQSHPEGGWPYRCDLKASAAAISLLLLALESSDRRTLEPAIGEVWHEYRRPRAPWPELFMLDAAIVLASGDPEPAREMVASAAHHASNRRCCALEALAMVADRLEVFAGTLGEAASVNLRSRQAGGVDSALLALCAVPLAPQRLVLIDRWVEESHAKDVLALAMPRDGLRVEIGFARDVERLALRYLALLPSTQAEAAIGPPLAPDRVALLVREARLSAAGEACMLWETSEPSVGSLISRIVASPIGGVTSPREV